MEDSIYPDILIQFSKSLQEKLPLLFAYKVILLHPHNKDIDDIIVDCKCPSCNGKLLFTNCFNIEDNYKITFIRTCHRCNILLILNGRYSRQGRFNYAYNFFKNIITDKSVNRIEIIEKKINQIKISDKRIKQIKK